MRKSHTNVIIGHAYTIERYAVSPVSKQVTAPCLAEFHIAVARDVAFYTNVIFQQSVSFIGPHLHQTAGPDRNLLFLVLKQPCHHFLKPLRRLILVRYALLLLIRNFLTLLGVPLGLINDSAQCGKRRMVAKLRLPMKPCPPT